VGHKPIPDASLEATGREAAKFSNIARYERFPTQKIRSELFSFARLKFLPRLKTACVAGSKCATQCEGWFQLMNDADFKTNTKGFPMHPIGAAGIKAYAEFESTLLTCAKGTEISALEPASQVAIRKAFEDLVLQSRKSMDVSSIPPFANLAEGIEAVGVLFEARDKAAVAARHAAALAGLGFYTTEQEADELSAEWLALIGVDPKASLAGQLFTGRDIEKHGGNVLTTEISMDECASLLASGWKDASVTHRYVQIGSFSDPHHGACYRIYNLDRELRAHKYAVGPAPAKPLPPWKDVQKAL